MMSGQRIHIGLFFLFFLISGITSFTIADLNYEFIVLGSLGGGDSCALNINNLGQIVGYAHTGEYSHAFLINPEDTDEDGTPDLWYRDDDVDGINDLMIDLGTLGGNLSAAYGVNIHGQVVGSADTSPDYPPHSHAFLITPLDTDYDGVPDLWYYDADQDGANDLMMDLGTLGGGNTSKASDINDFGQVVGDSGHAFLWHYSTGMIDLGTLGGSGSSAWAINNLEQVTGSSTNSFDSGRAFIWENSLGMRDLGTFGGQNSYGSDINNLGQIVGRAQNSSGEYHAFLWQDGLGMIDLGTLGYVDSYAYGINNRGQVVGRSYVSPEEHAFFWENGEMVDLNDYLPNGSDWELTLAWNINDGRQIVGSAQYDTERHAFLLNPIPFEYPIMSNGSVSPSSGYYGTRFEFTARYFHGEGTTPLNIYVNIDGTDYEMTLKAGSASNGIYKYRTRDLSADTPHIYYFHAEDGQGGSCYFPESSNLDGPVVYGPELFITGTPTLGSWMTAEVWGVAEGMWAVAASSEPGPFYVPATGLTFDIGPGGIHMIKKITGSPLYLDAYGYGVKNFPIPPDTIPGVKFIQGATCKSGRFWAKTNRESVIVTSRRRAD